MILIVVVVLAVVGLWLLLDPYQCCVNVVALVCLGAVERNLVVARGFFVSLIRDVPAMVLRPIDRAVLLARDLGGSRVSPSVPWSPTCNWPHRPAGRVGQISRTT